MSRQSILLIVLFVVQLLVPSKMVYDHLQLINSGHRYFFKCIPLDPADPFKGRYVYLNFENQSVTMLKDPKKSKNTKVYITFSIDSNQKARAHTLSTSLPNTTDYLYTQIIDEIEVGADSMEYVIDVPIHKYFMNEFKALQAEQAYINATRDGVETMAEVVIWKGQIQLVGLYINGVPIETYVNVNE